MSDRRRRRRILGEYELDGGAFGRREQRDIPQPVGMEPVGMEPGRRALSRPGTLWRAVLRRIRTD